VGKSPLLLHGADETKNNDKPKLELPAPLADRLWAFRPTIAPAVISPNQPSLRYLEGFRDACRGDQPDRAAAVGRATGATSVRRIAAKIYRDHAAMPPKAEKRPFFTSMHFLGKHPLTAALRF
jgi:hypothetical protein